MEYDQLRFSSFNSSQVVRFHSVNGNFSKSGLRWSGLVRLDYIRHQTGWWVIVLKFAYINPCGHLHWRPVFYKLWLWFLQFGWMNSFTLWYFFKELSPGLNLLLFYFLLCKARISFHAGFLLKKVLITCTKHTINWKELKDLHSEWEALQSAKPYYYNLLNKSVKEVITLLLPYTCSMFVGFCRGTLFTLPAQVLGWAFFLYRVAVVVLLPWGDPRDMIRACEFLVIVIQFCQLSSVHGILFNYRCWRAFGTNHNRFLLLLLHNGSVWIALDIVCHCWNQAFELVRVVGNHQP